jgi:hypothetical protein
MNLTDIGCEDVDWIYLAQNRVLWWDLVNNAINLGVLH